MHKPIQRRCLNALLLFLRPIARTMLFAGIGYREFAEVTKAAFVDVATKDFGLRGRPTNISRVAVMTGLTRKEVRRIRDKTEEGLAAVDLRTTPMAEILHRWYTDAEFLDESGNPLELGVETGDVNFTSLVRKYGGDIPPGAMRTELKRIGAVKELEDGSLRLERRSVSGLMDEDLLETILASVMYPAGLAMVNNVKAETLDDRWVLRSASTRHIRKDDLARVKRVCTERLKEFSESIDDLFVAYEGLYDREDSDQPSTAVGVGLFYFEEDKSETNIF